MFLFYSYYWYLILVDTYLLGKAFLKQMFSFKSSRLLDSRTITSDHDQLPRLDRILYKM